MHARVPVEKMTGLWTYISPPSDSSQLLVTMLLGYCLGRAVVSLRSYATCLLLCRAGACLHQEDGQDATVSAGAGGWTQWMLGESEPHPDLGLSCASAALASSLNKKTPTVSSASSLLTGLGANALFFLLLGLTGGGSGQRCDKASRPKKNGKKASTEKKKASKVEELKERYEALQTCYF